MSEKVRYYLEQSITELQDLKKRGIFDDGELKIIMKRRTDYEHRITSRTVRSSEFLSYANYEMNVEKLRSIRLRRLKKQGSSLGSGVSDWAGSRRITFIFDRATKRFPQDLGLWMRLIEYGKQQNAPNVVNKSMSSMLKLHPTNPEVWVLVAKYQAENNASIQEARAVLQRGLRFNADSSYLWLEYMRLELIYAAKILARRKLLGIKSAHSIEEGELKKDSQLDLSAFDVAAAEKEIKNLPDVNIDVLGDVSSNPVLRGEVALAVFDAAISQIDAADQVDFCDRSLEIFDNFTLFDRAHLCNHVIVWAEANVPNDGKVQLWRVSLPVRFCSNTSPELPQQLRLLFNLYSKKANHPHQMKDALREYLASRFLESAEGLDQSLKQAVEMFISKM